MCGRFSVGRTMTLDDVGEGLAAFFNASREAGEAPSPARFNVAPGQLVPVIRPVGGGRSLCLQRWGFVFPWARDPKEGPRPINARIETVAQKPAFRAATKEARCLVPADGFYEWRKLEGARLPWYFALKDDDLFAFAGIVSRWEEAGSTPVETFAILTTRANEVVAPVHDRMPVMLASAEERALWLAGAPTAEFETPLPAAALTCRPVGERVNDVHNDDARLIEPVPPDPQRRLL